MKRLASTSLSLRAHPDDPALIVNLAVVEFKAGRYQQVIDRCQKVLELRRDFAPALLFLGASYFQTGRYAEAIAPLGRAVEVQPDERNGRLMLAESLLRREKYREAAIHFHRLSGSLPASPRVWYGLERSYHMLSAQAATALEGSAPESAFSYALAGDNAFRIGKYGRAIHCYRRALETRPEIRGVHTSLARAYTAAGHPEWATPSAQSELQPSHETALATGDSPEALYYRTRAANELAVRAYEKLAALPRSVEYYELTARQLDSRGRHLEAAKDWRQALDLAPDNATVQEGLALSLYNGRDLDGALPMLKALLKKESCSAALQFLVGSTLLRMDRPSDALQFFETALQCDAEFEEARGALGEAHLKLGDARKAIPYLEAARSSDEDGSRHFQLARAYRAIGAVELAASALERYGQLRRTWETKRRELEADFPISPP